MLAKPLDGIAKASKAQVGTRLSLTECLPIEGCKAPALTIFLVSIRVGRRGCDCIGQLPGLQTTARSDTEQCSGLSALSAWRV